MFHESNLIQLLASVTKIQTLSDYKKNINFLLSYSNRNYAGIVCKYEGHSVKIESSYFYGITYWFGES